MEIYIKTIDGTWAHARGAKGVDIDFKAVTGTIVGGPFDGMVVHRCAGAADNKEFLGCKAMNEVPMESIAQMM